MTIVPRRHRARKGYRPRRVPLLPETRDGEPKASPCSMRLAVPTAEATPGA